MAAAEEVDLTGHTHEIVNKYQVQDTGRRSMQRWTLTYAARFSGWHDQTTNLVCLAARDEKELSLNKRKVSADEAKQIGATLGINWAKIGLGQFQRGLEVEFEHGTHDPETNVTNDDAVLTGEIAWAHLKEFPDYYTRLARLEAEADASWASRR